MNNTQKKGTLLFVAMVILSTIEVYLIRNNIVALLVFMFAICVAMLVGVPAVQELRKERNELQIKLIGATK